MSNLIPTGPGISWTPASITLSPEFVLLVRDKLRERLLSESGIVIGTEEEILQAIQDALGDI